MKNGLDFLNITNLIGNCLCDTFRYWRICVGLPERKVLLRIESRFKSKFDRILGASLHTLAHLWPTKIYTHCFWLN